MDHRRFPVSTQDAPDGGYSLSSPFVREWTEQGNIPPDLLLEATLASPTGSGRPLRGTLEQVLP